MKTLALFVEDMGGTLYITERKGGGGTAFYSLRAAGFGREPVTLIDSASLAPLLAREAYRVHCWECHECECYIQVSGTPAPDSLCIDGQRLAAAITSAKEGTL